MGLPISAAPFLTGLKSDPPVESAIKVRSQQCSTNLFALENLVNNRRGNDHTVRGGTQAYFTLPNARPVPHGVQASGNSYSIV